MVTKILSQDGGGVQILGLYSCKERISKTDMLKTEVK